MKKRAKFVSSRDGGFLEEIAEFLDGRSYTLDGIAGTIRVQERPRGSYYGGGTELRIYHEPSKIGRQSAAYRKIRAQLHDDWTTDLTNSERLIEIVTKLDTRRKFG